MRLLAGCILVLGVVIAGGPVSAETAPADTRDVEGDPIPEEDVDTGDADDVPDAEPDVPWEPDAEIDTFYCDVEGWDAEPDADAEPGDEDADDDEGDGEEPDGDDPGPKDGDSLFDPTEDDDEDSGCHVAPGEVGPTFLFVGAFGLFLLRRRASAAD